MSLEYRVADRTYGLSYSNLVTTYEKFVGMSDTEFMRQLGSAIHFACFVAWLKELPSSMVLSDEGVIHELAHLLDPECGGCAEVARVRSMFNEQLKLVR